MEIEITIIFSLVGILVGAGVTLFATSKQTKNANKFIVLNSLKTQITNDIIQFQSTLNRYNNLLSKFSLAIIENDNDFILGESYTNLVVMHNELKNLNNNLNGNYELMVLLYGKKTISNLDFEDILLRYFKHLKYQNSVEHPIIVDCINKYSSGTKIEEKQAIKLSRQLLHIYTDTEGIAKQFTELMGLSGVGVIEFINSKISKLL